MLRRRFTDRVENRDLGVAKQRDWRGRRDDAAAPTLFHIEACLSVDLETSPGTATKSDRWAWSDRAMPTVSCDRNDPDRRPLLDRNDRAVVYAVVPHCLAGSALVAHCAATALVGRSAAFWRR